MKRRFVVMVIAAVCFAAPGGRLRGPVPLVACGPFPPQYGFARAVMPDAPRYEEGQLGIVQPSFERRYLFVAWRYLNGVPLTGVERKTVALPSLSGGYVSPSAPGPGEAVAR